MSTPQTRRLFFALWPGAATRAAVVAATAPVLAACGGRPVPAQCLHVTLAFLGSVPERDLPRVERAAAGLAAAPLMMDFDTVEIWRKPRVLVASTTGPADEGAACARALWQRLEPLGLLPDERPWRPHITLARKVGAAPAAGLPPLAAAVHWEARDFVLVDSVTTPTGPEYRVIGRWPLAGR